MLEKPQSHKTRCVSGWLEEQVLLQCRVLEVAIREYGDHRVGIFRHLTGQATAYACSPDGIPRLSSSTLRAVLRAASASNDDTSIIVLKRHIKRRSMFRDVKEHYYFVDGRVTPYRKLAALLRLSTKYLCDPLRRSVINHLSLIYSSNRRFVRWQESAALIPAENKEDHGLLAVQMAWENNVSGTMLPVAFYFASTMDPTALLEYPDVSTEIKLLVSTGRARLSAAALQTGWHHVSTCGHQKGCTGTKSCRAGYLVAMRSIFSSAPNACHIFLEPYPHENDKVRSKFCDVCWRNWLKAEMLAYEKMWNELPSYFGLDPWPSK
ncbi:hypothetical protein BDZ89DRAFT_1142873 [Hymenopellis radicata]|nr:hypothetical protein BDZ89DRAFT_1142873 [Hymenopellis radicata]